jgi:hypothetical protein
MLDHMILYYVLEYIYPCSRSRVSAAPAAPPPPRLRVRDDAQTQWRIRVNRSQWGLGLSTGPCKVTYVMQSRYSSLPTVDWLGFYPFAGTPSPEPKHEIHTQI